MALCGCGNNKLKLTPNQEEIKAILDINKPFDELV